MAAMHVLLSSSRQMLGSGSGPADKRDYTLPGPIKQALREARPPSWLEGGLHEPKLDRSSGTSNYEKKDSRCCFAHRSQSGVDSADRIAVLRILIRPLSMQNPLMLKIDDDHHQHLPASTG